MEYITSAQLKEESKEVQATLIKWWDLDDTDLVLDGYNLNTEPFKTVDSIINKLGCKSKEEFKKQYFKDNEIKLIVPLFTEGQLRQFIEDKTKGLVELKSKNFDVELIIRNDEGRIIRYFHGLERPIIAYWKIACEISTKY